MQVLKKEGQVSNPHRLPDAKFDEMLQSFLLGMHGLNTHFIIPSGALPSKQQPTDATHSTKKPLSTTLSTSKNVLFPGHNHLLTIGTDDPSLTGTQAIIKVSSDQHRWLAGGYDLEIGHL